MNYQTAKAERLQSTLTRADNSGENQKLKDACYDFEALLVKQMLDSMRKTVNKTNLFGDEGMSRDIFEDMLHDEYAKKMTRSANFGIAESLYKQFSSCGIDKIV